MSLCLPCLTTSAQTCHLILDCVVKYKCGVPKHQHPGKHLSIPVSTASLALTNEANN